MHKVIFIFYIYSTIDRQQSPDCLCNFKPWSLSFRICTDNCVFKSFNQELTAIWNLTLLLLLLSWSYFINNRKRKARIQASWFSTTLKIIPLLLETESSSPRKLQPLHWINCFIHECIHGFSELQNVFISHNLILIFIVSLRIKKLIIINASIQKVLKLLNYKIK